MVDLHMDECTMHPPFGRNPQQSAVQVMKGACYSMVGAMVRGVGDLEVLQQHHTSGGHNLAWGDGDGAGAVLAPESCADEY